MPEASRRQLDKGPKNAYIYSCKETSTVPMVLESASLAGSRIPSGGLEPTIE